MGIFKGEDALKAQADTAASVQPGFFGMK